MASVTASEVLALLDKKDACVDSYINTAHLIVTEDLDCTNLSAARKKQIELYLAAHFATISLEKGGIRKKKIGESEEEYITAMSKTSNAGYLSTRFGTQAVALDTCGILGAQTSNPVKALIRVI